jgi:hypothetical protein
MYVVGRGSQVLAFDGAPEVLFDVFSADAAGVGDEVRHVEEAFGGLVVIDDFEDGAGDYGDVEFGGEGAVLLEVGFPVAACKGRRKLLGVV